jgi:hypothetical protein
MSPDSLSQAWGPVQDYLFPSGWRERTALSQIRNGVITSQPRVALTGGSVLCRLNNQRETNKLGMKEIEKPLSAADRAVLISWSACCLVLRPSAGPSFSSTEPLDGWTQILSKSFNFNLVHRLTRAETVC